MRQIKSEQLHFYCNCLGELHDCGKRNLEQVEDLPLPLQSVYENFWTANLSVLCYIAFLDSQPGILLSAEYDVEYCQEQGLPTESDAQYVEIHGYGEHLEKLAHSVNPDVIVGISPDDPEEIQLLMFIPTNTIPIGDIPKLYYLMEKFGYTKAPDTLQISKEELTGFINSLGYRPEIEQQMLACLTSNVEEITSTGTLIQYMGMQIDSSDLYSKHELIRKLNIWGALDSSLDKIREEYAERFGNQLIWKYPFSDDMQGGGTIVPVQEGFLFLPYSCVFEHSGARYDLSHTTFLNDQMVQTLQTECKAYMDGLLAALGDISAYEQSYIIRQYTDAKGNIYYVRNDSGCGYKGTQRYAVPKRNGKREGNIDSLQYTHNIRKAQLDLDQYAAEHNLRPLADDKMLEGRISFD